MSKAPKNSVIDFDVPAVLREHFCANGEGFTIRLNPDETWDWNTLTWDGDSKPPSLKKVIEAHTRTDSEMQVRDPDNRSIHSHPRRVATVDIVNTVQGLVEGMTALRKELKLKRGVEGFERLDGGADIIDAVHIFNIEPTFVTPMPTGKFNLARLIKEFRPAADRFIQRCNNADDPHFSGYIVTRYLHTKAAMVSVVIDGRRLTLLEVATGTTVLNPAHRGKGAWTACLAELEEICPWDGIIAADIDPRQHNSYLSRGYVAVGERDGNKDFLWLTPTGKTPN